jgi:regulator of sirC expression with transglutaminase-like and TPR domain
VGRDHEVDLFGAAMILARLGNPHLNPHHYAARLDAFAEAALDYADRDRQPEHLAAAIDYQLFSVLGFTGNEADYGNPENSYLDVVIDRRTGIPITLALVYMEVAQRIGLRCDGIGYPGHFLVRCGEPDHAFYVDPFHQGQRIDRAELLAGLRSRATGLPSPESLVLPITRRQLLQRMLNNLRSAYRNSGDLSRWRAAVELQLRMEPWNAALIGERGMLASRLGDVDGALADLQCYVEAGEPGDSLPGLARLLEELRTQSRPSEETP